jgi:hypothetical protein
MSINRITNIWKRFVKDTTSHEERQKTVVATTPTPRFLKETTPGATEQDYNFCKELTPDRYVLPMWTTSFVPGEETDEQQFGPNVMDRFFTVGVFFERLETQGSKLSRQVRNQVDADWSIRSKLTRLWTKILKKRHRVCV